MFLSYQYIKSLGYDEATKKYRYQYKIIDTDFEAFEVGFDLGLGLEVEVAVALALIETYRKRNLPVVPNLIRFWQFASKKYNYSMEELIDLSKQYNPYHAEYEDEINKYLLLL